MIFDNDGMIADGLAHDGTPTVIDLGTVKPGPGRPITLFIQGVGVVGATGVAFTDGATVSAADSLISVTASVAEINAGIEVELPSITARYLQGDLVGTTSAGTWSCGLILDRGQTNL